MAKGFSLRMAILGLTEPSPLSIAQVSFSDLGAPELSMDMNAV